MFVLAAALKIDGERMVGAKIRKIYQNTQFKFLPINAMVQIRNIDFGHTHNRWEAESCHI